MDILISSNLERLLYHLDESKEELTPSCMEQLSKKGFYSIDKDILKEFYAGYSSEASSRYYKRCI